MVVKIDKSKCTGCRICVSACPYGIEMVDGVANIKNENADCLKDAADSCPKKCIILEGGELEEFGENNNNNFNQGVGQGQGMGMGQGQGQGRGMGGGQGRGMGMGPRDGRGGGRGGGGRK